MSLFLLWVNLDQVRLLFEYYGNRIDKPTSGNVILDGNDISKIKESLIANFRRDNLGFVFQDFNLLDTFTLEDNIYLPLVLAGKSYMEMHDRLLPISERLGIYNLLKKVSL